MCFVAAKTWMPLNAQAGCRSRRPQGARRARATMARVNAQAGCRSRRPAGRPKGEGHDGPSQCAGRMPEPAPAGRPKGEGQDGPHQRRELRMGERQPSSLDGILGRCTRLEVKDASAAPARPVWSTGCSSLNARLAGGRWPTASLIEVLLDDSGLGEVQLFLPALVESQRVAGRDRADIPCWSGLRLPMSLTHRLWCSRELSWHVCWFACGRPPRRKPYGRLNRPWGQVSARRCCSG